jgi:hypothetical protein
MKGIYLQSTMILNSDGNVQVIRLRLRDQGDYPLMKKMIENEMEDEMKDQVLIEKAYILVQLMLSVQLFLIAKMYNYTEVSIIHTQLT